MSPLGDLVRDRLHDRGWSYAELARRSGLPRSTVHYLATREQLRRVPEPAVLEALARGLELPVDRLRRAAAATAGITVYEETSRDPDVSVLIASVEQLTPEDRRHVTALVESLLRRAEGRGE